MANNKKIFKILIPYIIGILLCLIILGIFLKSNGFYFTIPINAGLYDVPANGAWVKGMIDNGWFLTNNKVGMPFGQNLRDFPMSDSFHFLIMKIISFFVQKNYVVTINVYYILTFILTVITSIYVFKYFGISNILSIFGALLYAFIPYHLFRNESHLFLSGYYMLPLGIMILLLVYLDEKFLFYYDKEKNKFIKNLINKKSIFAIIVCIIIGNSGVYYAFFLCYFLLAIGIITTIKEKNKYKIFSCLFLIAIISLAVLINLTPTIIYTIQQGGNHHVGLATRTVAYAESLTFKITQLFMPNYTSQYPFFAKIQEIYELLPGQMNTERGSYLGIFGSIGLIILLINTFLMEKETKLLNSLSILNLSGLLIGVTGGIGTFFALFISPAIRAYNRISIYLGFFCIFGLLIVFEYIKNKIETNKIDKIIIIIIIAQLLVLGIINQTKTTYMENKKTTNETYLIEDRFIKKIENLVPENSMIFQLPYVIYPEGPPVNSVCSYDLAAGYLHSKNLRWSFGAIDGRLSAYWQKEVSSKPTEEMLKEITICDFKGIYIDKRGYADSAAKLEEEITQILGENPIKSDNDCLLFYPLINYYKKISNSYSFAQIEELKKQYLIPLNISWQDGFYEMETDKNTSWRFCSSNGKLVIDNGLKIDKNLILTMSLKVFYPKNYKLRINNTGIIEELTINDIETPHEINIKLSPGKNVISFECDAPRLNAPNDTRIIVFAVINPKIIVE